MSSDPTSHPRSLPTDPASALPTLTPQESYLTSLEDDELLPLISNRKPNRTERERLELAGNGFGAGRGQMGSQALHDELGEQLAEISHQLKLNAMHFNKSLESEKDLLQNSQDVLQNNLTRTEASKSKLSVITKKSRSTTWLTFITIFVVMIAWTWTYILIRFT